MSEFLLYPLRVSQDDAALHNRKLQGYLRAFASYHGLNSNDNNPNISYNTRVELAEKHHDDDGEEDGWNLTVKTLVDGHNGTLKAIWRKEVREYRYFSEVTY